MRLTRRNATAILPALAVALADCAAGSIAGTSASERRIPVDGDVEIYAADAGPRSSAPPLVFIPGWSTDIEVWRSQIDHFSRSRRVLALDPRSQGRSTMTLHGNTPEQRAEDISAVLRALNVERPILVGWSQGVQDVGAYAAKFGTDRLSGIVLVDAALSQGASQIREDPEAAARQLELLNVYAAHQREYLQGMWHAITATPLPGPLMEQFIDTGMATAPSIGIAMLIADLYGVDRSDALAGAQIPTLVVASDRSPELVRQQSTAASLERGRFEVIANAGHALFIDQPAAFNALLERFVNTVQT